MISHLVWFAVWCVMFGVLRFGSGFAFACLWFGLCVQCGCV